MRYRSSSAASSGLSGSSDRRAAGVINAVRQGSVAVTEMSAGRSPNTAWTINTSPGPYSSSRAPGFSTRAVARPSIRRGIISESYKIADAAR